MSPNFLQATKKAAPQFFSTLLVFHQTFLNLSIVSETYKAVGSLLLSCLSHCFTPTKQTKHILKQVSQVGASIFPKMHFHRRSAHLLCVSAAEPVLLQTWQACLKTARQPPRLAELATTSKTERYIDWIRMDTTHFDSYDSFDAIQKISGIGHMQICKSTKMGGILPPPVQKIPQHLHGHIIWSPFSHFPRVFYSFDTSIRLDLHSDSPQWRLWSTNRIPHRGVSRHC